MRHASFFSRAAAAALLAGACLPAHAQFNLRDMASQIGSAVGRQAAPEGTAAQQSPAATSLCRGPTGLLQPCSNGAIDESDPAVRRARALEDERAADIRRKDDAIRNFNCRSSQLTADDTVENCEKREAANRQSDRDAARQKSMYERNKARHEAENRREYEDIRRRNGQKP